MLRLPLIFAACTIAAGVLDSFLPITKGVPRQPLLGRPARPGDHRNAQPLAGRSARRQVRSRRAAYPGAYRGGTRHGRDDVAGVAGADFREHGAVRRRVGVIEYATFALLIEQLPEARAGTLWNLAYDTGYGAGKAMSDGKHALALSVLLW
jgi:hypothetical protein